ncbi:YihY/virulence factor BrkB family protein [Candidatus Kaiserbacteria bacterium]|nr:YihY/virulence factor BrkB family protein [Candidatus Kaiserbacteria bacterium]
MKTVIKLFKQAGLLWYHSGADTMAAAVSYYAMFALVPLILFSLYVVSILYGEEYVVEVMLAWGSGMGTGVVLLLKEAVANLSNNPPVLFAPVVGATFLLLAVLIFMNTFTKGLHNIWGSSHIGFLATFQKSVRALVYVFILQIFIIALIAAEFAFALIFEGAPFATYLINILYVFAFTVLVVLLFSVLPLSDIPSLESRVYGGLIAALCFVMGKTFVSFHIAVTPIPDLFGAAGVALVLLLWVYVSTSFVYFGAAFAKVHDEMKNRQIDIRIENNIDN